MFGVAHDTIWRAAYNIKPRKKRRRKVRKIKRGPAMTERTHCPHGHEYTPANTVILKKARKDGSIGHKRQCKACKKAWRPKATRLKEQRARQGEANVAAE